jgi:hypothetical protein
MQFAVNWSPQARDLLRAGRIHIDRFKCPDWDNLIHDARMDAPVYVHFPLVVGSGALAATDWKRVEALLAETDTPHVNLHLEPSRRALGRIDDNAVIEMCVREIERVASRFGGAHVVLENVPFRRGHADLIEIGYHPEAISAIIGAAGCRLLLDTGHARISAHELGWDLLDYLRALPLDRLAEVHVAGVITFTPEQAGAAMEHEAFAAFYREHQRDLSFGSLIDHFGMESQADWDSLIWLVDQIRTGAAATPRFIAFEYGGVGPPFAWRSDSVVIARDVPRLYALINGEPVRRRPSA